MRYLLLLAIIFPLTVILSLQELPDSLNSVLNRIPDLSPVPKEERENKLFGQNQNKSTLDTVLDFFSPRATYADTLQIDVPHITQNYKQFISTQKGLITVLYYNRCTSSPRVKNYFGYFLADIEDTLAITLPVYAVDLFNVKNHNQLKSIARDELNLENRTNDLNGVVFYFNGRVVLRYTDYCAKCPRPEMDKKIRNEVKECIKFLKDNSFL